MSSPQTLTHADALARVLDVVEAVQTDPLRFGVYENDPVGFCTGPLGIEHLWLKQQEVLAAVASKPRISVRSGHSVGKTFIAACTAIWWLYARRGIVVTTAPSKEHVEDVLWREIAERFRHAPVRFPGAQTLTEHRIDNTWYAVGITAKNSDSFQGRHHPRLLVIVDEPTGVSEEIHLAISTLTTGVQNAILMIGNPTLNVGTFADSFKHPDIWHAIKISCLDHPNVIEGREVIPGAVTREWLAERRRMWGEHHPFWGPRVLGEFPQISVRGVIPLGWLERAQDAAKQQEALAKAELDRVPRIGGLDVARYGDNACVLTIRRGDAVEEIETWAHKSLMETTGMAVRAIRDRELKLLVVDAAGLGAGVADRLLELHQPILAYNGGHRAFTPSTFGNRRSELWWHLRSRFEQQRLWLPQATPPLLLRDLLAPEYEIASSGRLRVETKEQLLNRGFPSPDFADSLVMCFAAEENPDLVEPVKPGPEQDPWPGQAVENAGWSDAPFANLPAGF